MTEAQLHKAVAQYLDLALPSDAWWTTIPLGGGGRIRGAHLKARGARKGTPDLMIVYRGRPVFLELKQEGKYATPEQRACHDRLTLAGAVVRVCRSIEDVQEFLSMLIPLRTVAV